MKDKTFTIFMNVLCTIIYLPFILLSTYVTYLVLTDDKVFSNTKDDYFIFISKPYILIPLIIIGNTILIVDLYKKYTGKYKKNEG